MPSILDKIKKLENQAKKHKNLLMKTGNIRLEHLNKSNPIKNFSAKMREYAKIRDNILLAM